MPDPREVSREKIAFLLALHALMMGDEGSASRRSRQLGAAIRAVYAKAAALPGTRRRASRMLRDELRAEGRGTASADGASTSPRRCATSPTRLGEYCGEGTYAYLLDRETTVPRRQPAGRLRHPPLPGRRAAAR